MKSGLLPRKADRRDYSYHRTFGSAILSRIPDEFDLDVHLTMPDQNADGLYQACTSYTHTDIFTDETRKLSSPLELYKKTMEILGIKPDDSRYLKVPCDIRHALKAAQQLLGFPSYFDVLDNKPFDAFDTLRMVMYTEGKPCTVGTPWLKEWERPQNGIITETFIYDESASWHCYKLSGVKKIDGVLYLVAKSWQGKNFGDNGLVYFPRSVINKAFAIGGTFAYTLATPPINAGEIKTVTLPWWQDLLSKLIVFLTSLTKPKVDTPPAIVEQAPEPPLPPAPVEEKPKYLWDTKENAIHSCRVIMDEYHLNWVEKATLCATIEAESNFKTNAVNYNKDKNGKVTSEDWGIVQINTYFNVGPGKPFASVEEVVNNPEKCVRFMIEMYQQGHIDYWNAHKSGLYLKYFDKYLAWNPTIT